MNVTVISHDTRKGSVGDFNGEIFYNIEDARQFLIEKGYDMVRDDGFGWNIDMDEYCDEEDHFILMEMEVNE